MSFYICGALVLADVVTSKPDIIALSILNALYQQNSLRGWHQQLRSIWVGAPVLLDALSWLEGRFSVVEEWTNNTDENKQPFRARNIWFFPRNLSSFFSMDGSHIHIVLRELQVPSYNLLASYIHTLL
jgi:hypothetical protein